MRDSNYKPNLGYINGICNRCDQRLFLLASHFFRLAKSLWKHAWVVRFLENFSEIFWKILPTPRTAAILKTELAFASTKHKKDTSAHFYNTGTIGQCSYRVTITNTFNTSSSCSENIMVLSVRRGFLPTWYSGFSLLLPSKTHRLVTWHQDFRC
jgi:hypothetical protein